MDKKFIQTMDKATMDLLIKEGYQLINESCGVYTFMNDKKIESFSKKENIVFSNMLLL